MAVIFCFLFFFYFPPHLLVSNLVKNAQFQQLINHKKHHEGEQFDSLDCYLVIKCHNLCNFLLKLYPVPNQDSSPVNKCD